MEKKKSKAKVVHIRPLQTLKHEREILIQDNKALRQALREIKISNDIYTKMFNEIIDIIVKEQNLPILTLKAYIATVFFPIWNLETIVSSTKAAILNSVTRRLKELRTSL